MSFYTHDQLGCTRIEAIAVSDPILKNDRFSSPFLERDRCACCNITIY
jgi:hypothetical protein